MAWSHTQEVKAELSRLPVGSPAQAAAELAGMWAVFGSPAWLPLASALVARRAYRLARRAGAEPALLVDRAEGRLRARLVLRHVEVLPDPDRLKSARPFLRGAFISRGYVADPERTYHLEMLIRRPDMADLIRRRLQEYGIEAQLSARRRDAVLYIKSQEQVGEFLAYLGAYNARLGLESLLVMRAVRNRVNRLVNGEAANLRRTAESGVRQQTALAQLMAGPEWAGLPDGLKELAVLRVRHPDWNLRELGQALHPPLSKSGVAHRLRRLLQWGRGSGRTPSESGHARGRRV